jgi:outer membrane protein assembly factor BamE (lipoprotein component of BamABCDE complex)
LRYVAAALAGMIFLSIAGCGGQNVNAGSDVNQGPYGAPQQPQQRQGMSTRQKVMLVAGAAALYYLYQKHKNKQGEGAQGRYYRSKNGRVYYRDLKTGKYQWVDPPQQPIQVPADEYQQYFGNQAQGGYDGGVIRQAPSQWNDPTFR